MSKQKIQLPKRNSLVVAALIKTGAGSHRKTNKALRREIKQHDSKTLFNQLDNHIKVRCVCA